MKPLAETLFLHLSSDYAKVSLSRPSTAVSKVIVVAAKDCRISPKLSLQALRISTMANLTEVVKAFDVHQVRSNIYAEKADHIWQGWLQTIC
jgi:hypothetical protein